MTKRNGGTAVRRSNGGGSRVATGNGANRHSLMAAEALRRVLRSRRNVDASELLPLSEPVFHILLALADRDLHGYGIILSVEASTAGKVRLRTGTLYTAVRRMVDEGLIAQARRSGADRRRFYTLTAFGRSVARAESWRIASLASLARERGLLARGARPHF